MDRTFTLDGVEPVAIELWETVLNAKVIAFHGEMGAGKTTFIHVLCDVKQVKDVVGSPTYSIINEYKTNEGKLFHIDLYRLEGLDEVVGAGVEECLYSGNICLVEWPERAAAIFPADTVHVYLDVVDEFTRRIRISEN